MTGDGLADAVDLLGADLVVRAGDGRGGFEQAVLRIEGSADLRAAPVGAEGTFALPAGHSGWWYATTDDATGLFRLADLF